MVSHNKSIPKKVERANQNKNFLLEKSFLFLSFTHPSPLKNLEFFVLESFKGRRVHAHKYISVYSLLTTLFASLLIQSVSLCIFNIPFHFDAYKTSRYYQHTWEQDVLCIYNVYLKTKVWMKTWKIFISLKCNL